MDSADNAYCRLCADLKRCSDVINLKINIEKRQETVNKLKRFNIAVNLDNILPKTVCFGCINSLERAFDFVTTVDQAQEAFNSEYGLVPEVKKNEVVSDDENNDCEDLGLSDDGDEGIKDEYNFEPLVSTDEDPKIDYEKDESLKPVAPTKRVRIRKKPKTMEEIELTESWDEYLWICGYCARKFNNVEELKLHSMQFHNTCNAFCCSECKAPELHLDNFVNHIRSHRPLLTLSCYKCSKKCFSTAEMRKHKASHFDTSHICSGCNSTFSNLDKLKEHTIMYYWDKEARKLPIATENKSLTCVVCQKTLKSFLILSRHLRLHTERQRKHVCDVCGKRFYNIRILNQHIVVHSEERPFKCEICCYSFKIRSELRKHVSIHFGIKPFVCEKCGKKFRRTAELKMHSLVHTDLRPYICTYCQKTFRFPNLLRQHIRLHTGEKPYSCNVCEKKFRNWQNYNKHMKEQHGINKAQKKYTVTGSYALDPLTGQIIAPETDKLPEWQNEVLRQRKLGRPKKIVSD